MIDGDAVLDEHEDDEDLEQDDQDDNDQEDGEKQLELDEQDPPAAAGEKPRTRRLDCKLTDEEIAKTARKMAALELEIENTEGHKKAAVKEYADELKEMRARAREYARGVREGVIKRSVEIREEVHNLLMVTVRLDTGETIESRNLTEEERQQAFAGMTAPEAAEAMPGAPEPEATQPEVPVVPTLLERVRVFLADYPDGRTVKDIAQHTRAGEAAVGDALEQLFVLGRAVRPESSRHKKWRPGVLAGTAVPEGGAP
jgi:hypothetical protein